MQIHEVIAREAIRHTLSLYNSAGDRGRVAELAQAFTPTGVLEFGERRLVGRDEIAAGLSSVGVSAPGHDRSEVPGFIRHHLTTSRVEMRGTDGADGWTYFQVITPLGLDHCGVYVDQFERVGEHWLISHRRVKVDWRSPDSLMAT